VTASEVPSFIDVSNVREDNLVFAAHTEARLDFRLFSVINKAHVYVKEGDDGKKIIWIYGDYGVGKSELAALLARLGTENGWTFALVRPGIDSWDYAIQMARQYAPKVIVFVEDAESVTGRSEAGEVSKMLDQLDGTEAKLLRQTLFVFTTNFIDKVQKAATRPGRADAIIRLGNLDRAGCERLAQIELGAMLAPDVDYDLVYADGWGQASTRVDARLAMSTVGSSSRPRPTSPRRSCARRSTPPRCRAPSTAARTSW
jgi:hypothetical protein